MRPLLVAATWLLLVLPSALPAHAAPVRSSGTVTVTALAVEETERGFVGVHATVEVQVLAEGSGRVYVSTKPLAQADMQGSARLAAQVAAFTLGADWRRQDYLVSFTSGSQVIGGPSAGAVMTLALTVALHNLLQPDQPWALDPKVAGTGTINPDGTIGPVGGVPAKAEGAKEAGITTFLYPAGLDKATTEVAGPGGLRQVTVDMASHCEALGIACQPVARLEELVSIAAHVDLQPRDVPVPSTLDYAAFLEPSVQGSLDRLTARLGALRADPTYASLRGSDRTAVDQEVRDAEARRDATEAALDAQHYYQAATESFQGAMAAGRAENLTRYVAASGGDAVVQAALRGCEQAVEAASEVAGIAVDDYTALYAVGAAQERLEAAQGLLEEARTAAAGRTVSRQLESLGASVFCTERARTVTWWAALRDEFPAGARVADLRASAQQAIDDAADLVSYAQAVMAGAGGSAGVQGAQARLQAAAAAFGAGRYPSAAVQAVEAASQASVAMQAAADGQVPPEVLAAARQGAARAIAQARGRGIEPMSSVSLVELAQSQAAPADALHSYWTARSLALLDVVAPEASPAPPQAPAAAVGHPGGYGSGTLVAFLVMGLVVGIAGSGTLLVLLLGRR